MSSRRSEILDLVGDLLLHLIFLVAHWYIGFPYADGLVAGDIITAQNFGLPLVPISRSSSCKPVSRGPSEFDPEVEGVSPLRRSVRNPGKRSRNRSSSSSSSSTDDRSIDDTVTSK